MLEDTKKDTNQIDVSIIIPAYNEAERLPKYLKDVVNFCIHSQKQYEIIIVDDGSQDKTLQAVEPFKKIFKELILIKNRKNRGKGYAVKKGFFLARGKVCLFLDADGSVKSEEIEKNLPYLLDAGWDIVIGSRVLIGRDQALKVKWYRKLLGKIFSFLIHLFLFKDIKDTQCGFKMFKREVIGPIFSRLYSSDFSFDFELLYVARKLNYKIKEVPVSWSHMSGSKVRLLIDSVKMFINILRIKWWHGGDLSKSSNIMNLGEYRDMYHLEMKHWWFVCRRNFIIDLIVKSNVSVTKLLDAGCGTAGNLTALMKMGEVFGVDISHDAVNFCRQRGFKNISQGSIDRLEYQDSTFDIITCLDVLEHIPNPLPALKELKRVLKNNGRIIITVPAFVFLWSRHDEALGHFRRYTKKALIQEIEEARLKVERVGYFFFFTFIPLAAVRLIMRRLTNFRGGLRADTAKMPAKNINNFLIKLFGIERKISNYFQLPFGSSLYIIVSKDNN